jgi:hypothetical protein
MGPPFFAKAYPPRLRFARGWVNFAPGWALRPFPTPTRLLVPTSIAEQA